MVLNRAPHVVEQFGALVRIQQDERALQVDPKHQVDTAIHGDTRMAVFHFYLDLDGSPATPRRHGTAFVSAKSIGGTSGEPFLGFVDGITILVRRKNAPADLDAVIVQKDQSPSAAHARIARFYFIAAHADSFARY
jgi:hypothetical protein